MPHPKEINVRVLLKSTLLHESSSVSLDKLLENTLLIEMNISAENGLFQCRNIPELLLSLSNIYSKLFVQNKTNMSEQYYSILNVLINLFIRLKGWTPSKNEKELIDQIVFGIPDYKHPALLLVMNNKYDTRFNVDELITEYLVKGSQFQMRGVIDTLILSVQFKDQLLSEASIKSHFELMVYQILWNNDNKVNIVLDGVETIIKLYPEILSNEEERLLLLGISRLLDYTEITKESDLESASRKGLLRINTARLVKRLISNISQKGMDIPEKLEYAKTKLNEPNEFVEIRKAFVDS